MRICSLICQPSTPHTYRPQAQGARGHHSVHLCPLGNVGERYSASPILSLLPYLTIPGWRFASPEEKIPGDSVMPDPIHENFTHLRDIYFDVDPEYKGRFTVPTLYDVKQNKIVSNEVIRFPNAFRTSTPSND